jgi:hypothetical protein
MAYNAEQQKQYTPPDILPTIIVDGYLSKPGQSKAGQSKPLSVPPPSPLTLFLFSSRTSLPLYSVGYPLRSFLTSRQARVVWGEGCKWDIICPSHLHPSPHYVGEKWKGSNGSGSWQYLLIFLTSPPSSTLNPCPIPYPNHRVWAPIGTQP